MTSARLEIRVGLGSCCQASGSRDVYDALQHWVSALRADASVREGGCVGLCHQVPLLEIVEPDGQRSLYGKVTVEIVPAILRRHVGPRGALGKLSYSVQRAWEMLTRDEAWESVEEHVLLDTRSESVRKFMAPQVRIATADCGQMDPGDIAEYRAHGGYAALERARRELGAARVIEAIKQSQLRGRGGGGFPTGRKWELAARQTSDVKYVICNGDEGDPGAFMDRMLLEAYPHRVLEGACIAAHAVGAGEVIFYIRQEYPLAVRHVRRAIDQARQAGLLEGLQVGIREGAGAFVCGEETALIASLEGRRGTPRLRPPYPAEQGLWGKPTLVNNVETLACVPWIIANGGEKFAAIGTPGSRGTKVFALAGKVKRGGLIEVPMGITMRQIVEEIGGGTNSGSPFKAVQIGGPSGGCIPSSLAERAVDYEVLKQLGAMMGSGGLVVLDDRDCMVDMARYFLQFTQNESCGKCTFCRIGTKRMLEILNRLCNGRAVAQDLAELETLANEVRAGSLCGLGQTAPNPVLTTLKYFRAEYEAHLQGKCPAGKCDALIRYHVTADCIGCTKCAQVCPVDAIEPAPYVRHFIDMNKCTRCHMCVQACPVEAIRVE